MKPTQLDYSATDITQPEDSVRATRRLFPAGKALVIGIVALLTATLFNASALLASAEAQNVGSPLRAITVSVMRPVASLSTALRLDVPRRVMDQALGRSAVVSDSATVVASPVAPAASTTTTTTTTTAPSSPRPVSPEDPLRVYLAADSFGQTLGPSLVNLTSDEGLIEVEYDFKILLDLAIGRETATTLIGQDLRDAAGPIDPLDVKAAVASSLRWHASEDAGGFNQTANAARSLRFLRTGLWGSKPDALMWATSQGYSETDVIAELAVEGVGT